MGQRHEGGQSVLIATLVGGELGWRADPTWEVFIEGGRMFDTTTAAMDTAATTIARFLGASASFTAKQPANWFDLALRYQVPLSERLQPYVAAGVGAATVSRNVSFFVNGSDVTSQLLDKYGVQLGTDLAGKETKALVTIGIGAQFRLSGALFGDLTYRFGRIFLSEQGLNTNRAQFGIGVRF